MNLSKHLYTNVIVTMISSDGLDHTPCMMFTYDPKMAEEQKKTDRGKRVGTEFEEALKCYNITEDRIINQKSAKQYFAETMEVLEHVWSHCS